MEQSKLNFSQTVTLIEFLRSKGGKIQVKKSAKSGKNFADFGAGITAMLATAINGVINAGNAKDLSVSYVESEDGKTQGYMVHPTGAGAEVVSEFSLEEMPEFKTV
jgi:hypothetical protein